MTLSALLLAAASQSTAAPPAPALPLATFGRFTLVQVQIEKNDLTSLAHPELRLQFQTSDRETTASLVDDGVMLALQASSAEKCSSGMPFLRYEGRVGEPDLFDALLKMARLHYGSGCGLRPATVRSHLLELRRSRADFAAGVQAMKARATELLGGWRRRCRLPQSGGGKGRLAIPLSWSPHDPCRGGRF